MEGKLMFSDKGNWLDISEYKLIFWGCGYTAQKISSQFQLNDLAYILDGDRNKWGSSVSLYGEDYIVTNPEILTKLDKTLYFIIITSTYVEEIKHNITSMVNDKFIICENITDLFFCYSSIDDLILCDPYFQTKNFYGKCTRSLKEYMKKAGWIISENLRCEAFQIKKFYSNAKGHKLDFFFELEGKKYYLSMPVMIEWGWRIAPSKKEIKSEIYNIKKILAINSELVLYEDREGFRLEKYAENQVDWKNDHNIENIFQKIKKLHLCTLTIDVIVDLKNRFDVLYKNNELEHKKEIAVQMEQIFTFLENKEKVLCHGDFHHGNIVTLNENIFIIDWESMCMCDPMYDVCRFIFYLSKEKKTDPFVDMKYQLKMYYDRILKIDEWIHAFAMMIYCESIEYFLQSVEYPQMEEKIFSSIMHHITEFENI